GDEADEQATAKQAHGEDQGAAGQAREGHEVGRPGQPHVVDAQAPAQPEEGLELLPVHWPASSSQLIFGVASESAPAFSRRRCSSDLPWRRFSSDACSTSSPLTMMPTCVHSLSTISSTCDVRNTVEPRPT